MSNLIQTFNSDKLPDFVQAGHPQFKAFLDAYYEWLESQNTEQSTSVRNLFNELDNPGGIISNFDRNLDIDETLDGFIDFFRKQIIPISIDFAAATDRFTIKKIKDVYLSKGTPKSFELLFRLLYDNSIDLFFPFEDVMEASEGTYIGFPVMYLRVKTFQTNISDIELKLSYITDSESSDDVLVTVLNGNVVGSDSDAAILKVQLNTNVEFDLNKLYYLFDANDENKYIVFDILPTIKEVTVSEGGSFYKENDAIKLTSKAFKQTHDANVIVSERSTVDYLAIRNRGYGYVVGDTFAFVSDSAYDGKGGSFRVTGVESGGRITEIDGIPLKTGILRNGYLASTFEEVVIPILNGGNWKVLPRIEYKPISGTREGAPYTRTETGYGFQVTPIASNLGKVKEIVFREPPYFKDSDDVDVVVPVNLVVQNQSGLVPGNVISFQTFEPSNDSFIDDSEILRVKYKAYRDVQRGYQKYHLNTFSAITGIDSELFQWDIKRYSVDSELGLASFISDFDSDIRLNFIRFDSEDDVFDGDDFDSLDSDGTVDVDGGSTFAITGTTLDLGVWGDYPGYYIDIEYKDNVNVNSLEDYHLDDIRFITKFNDSEFSFAYERERANPTVGLEGDIGMWASTDYFAKVVSVDGNVVRIVPETNKTFPTKEMLRQLSIDKYHAIRLEPIDNSGNTRGDVNLELTNILVYYSTFDIDYKVASTAEQVKFFINENGFASSPAGGVLHDNNIHSRNSYVIRSDLSMSVWREKIKTLLHPAGMYLHGDTILTQDPTNLKTPTNIKFEKSLIDLLPFDFSQAQDHYAEVSPYSNITADNQLYKANAYEFDGNAVNADNYTNIFQYSNKTQHGNAFWDYEPVGLVREEPIDYTPWGKTFENFDQTAQTHKVTTQDSDGLGYVDVKLKVWNHWDGSVQDLYKNNTRKDSYNSPPVMSRTFFNDAVSERYEIYDSEIPRHVFMRFTDSEVVMPQIDYDKLRSIGETRNMPLTPIPRQNEYQIFKNDDYVNAMREDGTFTYKVGDVTYKDFEAYEQKWNTWNTNRTYGLEGGWEIVGWHSFIQNTSNDRPRKRRNGERTFEEPLYSKLKTPLNISLWDNPSQKDFWIWTETYNKEINTTRQFDYDVIQQEEPQTVFDRDPEKWMLHRRVR